MVKKEKGEVNILRKILGFVPGILYNILIIFCVLLIAIIVMQRLTDSNRSINGYKIFKVVSGSMVPKYDVGEVVICKETPVEDIKVGNAIVYRGKIGELSGKLVMHEVIAINQDANNELKFYARGLNNSKGDPEISESQILGVVIFKSRILSLLYRLATSVYSSFIIITILVINVFVSFKSGDKKELPKEEKSPKKEKTNEVKTNKELQEEIETLKNEIQELKSQEDAKENLENDKTDNEDIDKKVVEMAESKAKSSTPKKTTTKSNTSKNATAKNNTQKKTTTKSSSEKKKTSKKEKKEEVVIDAKQGSDKID